MARIPDQLGAIDMPYSLEKSWGPGPGGNETGVAVYTLPKSIALRIEQEGLSFLSTFGPKWKNWRETPLVVDNNWIDVRNNFSKTITVSLSDYLEKYGHPIEIDRKIEKSINDAIRTPRNYYIYSSGGSLVVVVPSASQVFFIYAG